MGKGDTLLNSIIGAAIIVITSVTIVSPLLGGAVAAYLQEGTKSESIKVGAISGVLASIPAILLLFLLGGSLPVIGFGVGGAPGAFGAFAIIVLLITFVVALAYTIGGAALGGYLGWYVRNETDINL